MEFITVNDAVLHYADSGPSAAPVVVFANSLGTDTDYLKLSGQYLAGNHIITGGYEIEDNEIFNIFVQHSRGGEYDFFDDSVGNPAFCAALTAQERFDNPVYLSEWGMQYSIDSMLEHAVMYPILHRFQLQELLKEQGKATGM